MARLENLEWRRNETERHLDFEIQFNNVNSDQEVERIVAAIRNAVEAGQGGGEA